MSLTYLKKLKIEAYNISISIIVNKTTKMAAMDFDKASAAWRENKTSTGNGCSKYTCDTDNLCIIGDKICDMCGSCGSININIDLQECVECEEFIHVAKLIEPELQQCGCGAHVFDFLECSDCKEFVCVEKCFHKKVGLCCNCVDNVDEMILSTLLEEADFNTCESCGATDSVVKECGQCDQLACEKVCLKSSDMCLECKFGMSKQKRF